MTVEEYKKHILEEEATIEYDDLDVEVEVDMEKIDYYGYLPDSCDCRYRTANISHWVYLHTITEEDIKEYFKVSLTDEIWEKAAEQSRFDSEEFYDFLRSKYEEKAVDDCMANYTGKDLDRYSWHDYDADRYYYEESRDC